MRKSLFDLRLLSIVFIETLTLFLDVGQSLISFENNALKQKRPTWTVAAVRLLEQAGLFYIWLIINETGAART